MNPEFLPGDSRSLGMLELLHMQQNDECTHTDAAAGPLAGKEGHTDVEWGQEAHVTGQSGGTGVDV